MKDAIVVRGARQHNLKNIDLEIPRRTITVITGPSGSGKSSLAFDTIYAEGQRRYVESLSVYARQFLERMEKPDADSVEGLSPAVAIEQKNPNQDRAVDCRHLHRDLRLSEAPLGPDRTHLLPEVRPAYAPDTVQSVADRRPRAAARHSILDRLTLYRLSTEITHEVAVESSASSGISAREYCRRRELAPRRPRSGENRSGQYARCARRSRPTGRGSGDFSAPRGRRRNRLL